MSNEEDREALVELLMRERDAHPRDVHDISSDDLADAILAAGFHRTPAPAPDARDLVAEAREWAIEALVKERDDLKREMHARELHHFEEEQRSAGLAAVIKKAQIAGQVTGYSHHKEPVMKALYTAPDDALCEHDAALIESLAADFEKTNIYAMSVMVAPGRVSVSVLVRYGREKHE